MSETIITNVPDEPISGASLMRDSVAGRKTQFINDSTIGASGALVIASGSIHIIGFNLSLWSENLPSSARNANNIASYTDTVAWPSIDIYIDNDLNSAYYIGVGGSLTSDQQKVFCYPLHRRLPAIYSGSTRYSAGDIFVINNTGASSHTIYLYGQYKFITFGDINL